MAGTIKIVGDKVLFELSGVDEFFATKRSILRPGTRRLGLDRPKRRSGWEPFSQLRLGVGGLSFPGAIQDGRFLDSDGRMMFFEMNHPDKCVTLNLDHEKYKTTVFEVPDKEAAASMIRDALGSR